MSQPFYNIRFHRLTHYLGIEFFQVVNGGAVFYAIWLDKFYSAQKIAPLLMMVDQWWKLRMN